MTSGEAMWHPEVLSAEQRNALELTSRLIAPHPGMFLAGGTALALRFGHRRSRDLDWFSSTAFDHLAIAGRMEEAGARVVHAEPGTVHAECGAIAVSLIRYHYPVSLPDQFEVTPIASLRTAVGMKLLAIINRGYKRDFIDIAAMLRHGLDLRTAITWAMEDIPGLTMESALRSLAWRADADAQPDPDSLAPITWPQTKRELDTAIKRLVTH